MSLFFRIFWLTLLAKLTISYYLPLLPDEAYYWVWSHNLQLSYYDHPPMIAWLFRLGHVLEPYGHAVRFPAVIFLHLSLFTWKALFDELKISRTAFYQFLAFLMLVPYLGIGSIIMTPDLPLMFFWPLSLYFFIKILNEAKWTHYACLGAALGLGFLSKYHIVLFLLGAVVFLTLEKKWKLIQWKYIVFTFVFGLFFSSPVIVWNIKNGFQSFAFQLSHGLKSENWKWIWPLEYISGQFLMLLPPLGLYFHKARKIESLKTFFYFCATVLGFFFLTSFKSSVEMNWTLMAFPLFFAAIASLNISKKMITSVLGVLFVFNFALIVSMFSGYYPHGKIFEPFFFSEQKNRVDQYKPLYGINYQISSSLWYFSKTPVYKLGGASRFDFFDTLKEKDPKEKIIYVFKEERNEYPDWVYALKPKSQIVERLDRDYVIEKLEFP
ncbi:MAG: glycosyltransferase family 39 protein [Bdellovibrionaceae bacterium]|nr:glycosyltransferase family 39 protein [Pseudobdellovibrionaceae bacterium]